MKLVLFAFAAALTIVSTQASANAETGTYRVSVNRYLHGYPYRTKECLAIAASVMTPPISYATENSGGGPYTTLTGTMDKKTAQNLSGSGGECNFTVTEIQAASRNW